MTKSLILIAIVASIGGALVACSVDNRPQPQISVTYPRAPVLEGTWIDSNGINSSFQNGYFETRAADTQEKLSEGNYVMRSNDRVDIEIHSLVRGTVSRVNCIFANPQQLTCRSPEGMNFSLYRNG